MSHKKTGAAINSNATFMPRGTEKGSDVGVGWGQRRYEGGGLYSKERDAAADRSALIGRHQVFTDPSIGHFGQTASDIGDIALPLSYIALDI